MKEKIKKHKEDIIKIVDDLYNSGYKPNEFERDFLISIDEKISENGPLIYLTEKQIALLDRIIVKSHSRWNHEGGGYI